MTLNVAIYARVSSDRQAKTNTIASQIKDLVSRVASDGYQLHTEHKFIDNGYSGSQLIRPGLEKLRDTIASGILDCVYVHSPDRLSRKYAHQFILLEEFKKSGVEVIFLNHDIGDNPESQLLLQMQGMISEYERAKIMERNRRGKLHAANRGSLNVLSGAPYGYRYINKHDGGGTAAYIIIDEEAVAVKKIFNWIGVERLSIGKVCKRLRCDGHKTRFGRATWDRSVVWGMLKNPVYTGKAAFGKTKIGERRKNIRPQRHSSEHPKRSYSIYETKQDEWIYIPCPKIIDEDLFKVVQQQLEENRKRTRLNNKGANYLLQGLLVCQHCQYSFYGKPVRNKRGEKIDSYSYYRCIGTDAYRFGGVRLCDNKQVRTDTLEIAIWEEVKQLIKNPHLILIEYQRRLDEYANGNISSNELMANKRKIELGLSRLIDSYAEGLIDKIEFEPRIKIMKQKLKNIQDEYDKFVDDKHAIEQMKIIITSLSDFSEQLTEELNQVDWHKKRDIIRLLVKRIEISKEEVNVVFKINATNELSSSKNSQNAKSLQDCCRSKDTAYWTH